MELLLKLFSHWMQFTYHCFDRIILNGYHSGLSRPANIVYWIREVHQHPKVTKEFLRKRTERYQGWVESFAANQAIPIAWADHRRNDERMRPHLAKARKQQRFGLYYILKSREQGPAFTCHDPKYPSQDPNYVIVRNVKKLYTFYYFYIYDKTLGPIYLRIGSYVPFLASAYLNGHGYLARRLEEAGHRFRERENSIVEVDDPALLQQQAQSLCAPVIQQRLTYWSYRLGPKFSRAERKAMYLERYWCFAQVEYCLNFIFKRNRPIRDLFIRSCDLGLMTLTAERIAQFFGRRVNRRFQGKLHTVLERRDHGVHVLRAWFKNNFLKQYEKWRTFLRLEVVSNNVRELGVSKKGLRAMNELKEVMAKAVGRFAEASAINLNNAGQYDLLAHLAKPTTSGKSKTRVAGLRIESGRIARLLGLLMRGAPGNLQGWRSRELHQTALRDFELTVRQYSLNQLRYDLRKLKAHGILVRIKGSHRYRLTTEGCRAALVFVQIRRKIYGPIAKSQLQRRPDPDYLPDSKIERAYNKLNKSMDELVALLAA